MKSSIVNRLAALGMLVLVVPALASSPSLAQPAGRTFPETGKTVGGKFLAYWEANGGLAQQGFPISEEMQEVSATDGKSYTVQYFERGVFELHPENAGTKYEVLLSLLGDFFYQQRYPSGAGDQKASTDNAIKFSETGKSLGGTFRQYWEQHGGLAQQGFPISEEFQEKNDLDGKIYTVQYFERAVFEMHPENKPPFDVLLSQLGTFAYKARYQSGSQPTPTAGQVAATPTAQAAATPTATLPPAPPLHEVEFVGTVKDNTTPFGHPLGLTTDAQDNLYVVDAGTNEIFKFDSSGQLVMRFGGSGSDDGQFTFGSAGDIAVDSQGNLYVTDSVNKRIQKFDSEGHYLSKWGSAGTANGQFGRPESIAVDKQGNVYVIDDRYIGNEAGRIQKFDSNGSFLGMWSDMQDPGNIATGAQGIVYMGAYISNNIVAYDGSGKRIAGWSTSPLTHPAGIAVDNQGDIFVASGASVGEHQSTQYYVAEYNSLGQLLAHWGSQGSGDGQFMTAGDVAVDSQGAIYVSDLSNKSVQKFKLK